MFASKLKPIPAVCGNCFVCSAAVRITLVEPHPKSDTLRADGGHHAQNRASQYR
jgi:hypothetical protein